MKKFPTTFVWCLGFCWALSVAAQSYPTKPIRFIVMVAPGGGSDFFARVLGQNLVDSFGQQVIVENRAGAQGNVATAIGAKAPPDGYTLTLANVGTLSINPWLFRDVGFDPIKDFAAVARGVTSPWLLVIHPSVPAKSMKELAALAKQRPGKLSFASSSSAGAHMSGELFKQITGTDMLHIPYRGAGPALIDLMAGNIDMLYSSPAGPTSHVQSGKLRALGVTGTKRLPALPNVPTIGESGFPQFDDVTSWYGMVVPAATPKNIVAKLNGEIVRALRLAWVKERLNGVGLETAPSSPEEFAALIKADHERWGEIVKLSGVKYD